MEYKIGNEYIFSKSGNLVRVLDEPIKKGAYKGFCRVARVSSGKELLVPVKSLIPKE